MGQHIGTPTLTRPPGLSWKMGLTSVYFPILEKTKAIPLTTYPCTTETPTYQFGARPLYSMVQMLNTNREIIADIHTYVQYNPDKINDVDGKGVPLYTTPVSTAPKGIQNWLVSCSRTVRM